MPVCETIKIKHRKICVGDLDRQIEIYQRDLRTAQMDVDYREEFTKIDDFWAAVQTSSVGRLNHRREFDGTNLGDAFTHLFYIHFDDRITQEAYISFNGEYYDILETENIDERDEWMALYTNVRGDNTLPVNQT